METESPWNTGNKIDSHLGRTKRLNTMQTLIMLCFRCQRASWEVGVTEPKSLRAEPLAPPPPHFLYWKWSAPHSKKINKRCHKIPIFPSNRTVFFPFQLLFLAQPLFNSCKIRRSHTSSLLKFKPKKKQEAGGPAARSSAGGSTHILKLVFIEREQERGETKRSDGGRAVMGFQPPSRPLSSRMTGDVSVIVTCILGSAQAVRTMAASSMDPFTSYFSGVTTWKAHKHLVRHGPYIYQMSRKQKTNGNVSKSEWVKWVKKWVEMGPILVSVL